MAVDPAQFGFTPFQLAELQTDKEGFKRSIATKLAYSLGKDPGTASRYDWYSALCLVLRDRLVSRWHDTQKRIRNHGSRKVYYLSLEFLMGRGMTNAAVNLDLDQHLRDLIMEVGDSLEDVAGLEGDAGLGNGGLGRLAACYLDSMATLDLAGFGYGIRYDYGLFRQEIGPDGAQIEHPNNWLKFRNLWEIKREDIRYPIPMGGHWVAYRDDAGEIREEWRDAEIVEAVAYDTPIPGNNNQTVNHLRLWGARNGEEIDLRRFNHGDFTGALEAKNLAEAISYVLYPDDSSEAGKLLRIKQEYFFVSASLQDILHEHQASGYTLEQIPDQIAIQLNDTHPALAIPELMRLLCDEHGMGWEAAWDITRRTFNYTNHTLLPEALETWPVSMLERVVPRHLDIIYRINRHFLDEVNERYPGDNERRRRMSIIDEAGHDGRRARMAWLATIGSSKVNGVAELHSRLVRETIFRDFDEYYPGKFVNVTNGVTPRRWLKVANPALAGLVTDRIGRDWENDLEQLRGIEAFMDDGDFLGQFAAVKKANKERLAAFVKRDMGLTINPDSMFDVQIKRIHEYKRQMLNLLHVLTRYYRIREKPDGDWVPRTVVFAGKAAPGYTVAKWIIQLINNVADTINNDPRIGDLLKVVFVPNYNVSRAEIIIPAADLSEQISTAGMEASGTGNMKFALNGALTIGTLDGANVEIKEEVGDDNIFIFGLTAQEVAARRAEGYYPIEISRNNAELSHILHQVSEGEFSPTDLRRFKPLVNRLIDDGEYFLVLADYEAYLEAQDRVDELFRDQPRWTRMALRNTARVGRFSSDRSISDYARHIWELPPIG
ncbi:MAG: glycogen/starch/alpha-glucan phosphorylase [Gammaproteobacteria bacterium]|jgi:starch phosphorylase